MGKVKVKKSDVWIDMTPMSDVMTLLLTFFMLTSTFVKNEPVKVMTPGSISEIKVPENGVLTIVVSPEMDAKGTPTGEGQVFMSIDNTDQLGRTLDEMASIFSVNLTPKQIETFKTDKKFIVDSKNFHDLINSDKVVLVDFSSRHCGGCVKFAPTLNEIEKAYLGKASVVRVELDDNVELVKEQQIHSMPTIAIYKNGEIKWKKEGRLDRKEIETALNDNI